MKNVRNLVLAVMVMVGISAIESEGIYFWIALAMVIIPFAVLGPCWASRNSANKKPTRRPRRTVRISTTSPTALCSESGIWRDEL